MGHRKQSRQRRAIAFGAVLLACGAVAVASAQSPGQLTPAERRAIVVGDLVRRPETREARGSRAIGGTSFQRVRAPVEEVWRTVNDVACFPRLIPGADRARIVANDGSRRIVYLHHSYSFVEASYYTVLSADETTHTLTFDLDRSRPHDVEAGHGFLRITRYRGNESIVTWGILADVGAGLLPGLFAPLLHQTILSVPTCVRDEMETGTSSC